MATCCSPVDGHEEGLSRVDNSGALRFYGSAREFVKVLNWRGFLKPEAAGFGGWVFNHGPWVWRLDGRRW